LRYISVALPIPLHRDFFYSTEFEDIKEGVRVKVPFGRTERTGYVTGVLENPPSPGLKIKKINDIIDNEPMIPDDLMELAYRMSDYYVASIGEVLNTILPSYIKPIKRKIKIEDDNAVKESGFLLSGEQKKALKPLIKAAESGVYSKFLLHGITDSGKTEVYINLISELKEQGKQVILLVPEISITAQIVERLRKRFTAQRVEVWHSRVSAGRKMKCIERIREGKVDVLIGPRSAVFAPFPNLGAVIIDEEHDSSYKEGNSPFYDARWVAEERCRITGSVLVAGSATPSVETFYQCENENKYSKLTLSEKIHRDDLPVISIVDMKAEYEMRRGGMIFSKYLLDRLEKILTEGRQSIIFINKRGYSASVICKKCGESIKCSKCNVSLFYHSVSGKMMCHWCGYSEKPPDFCPECGGAVFKYSGFGTERVEKALRKIFPAARTVRMDFDTTARKGSTERIYNDFKAGKYDILVGTQLIAKGWDFSAVDLVGVINSDIGLNLPDFRAPEKTHALLRQVEGRTGRGSRRGEIVIQSFNPSHYAVKSIFDRDDSKFYEYELNIRREAGFPPFKKLINIICAHKNSKIAGDSIEKCSSYIKERIKCDILGPAPAPVFKLRGSYRYQMLIKHNEEKIKKVLKKMLKEEKFSGKIKLDVDPQNML